MCKKLNVLATMLNRKAVLELSNLISRTAVVRKAPFWILFEITFFFVIAKLLSRNMSDQVDAFILKGIKLLLSNDENSTEELSALLDEQIRLRSDPSSAEGFANLRQHPEESSQIIVENNPTTSKSEECMPPLPQRELMCLKRVSSDLSCKINFNSESSRSDSKAFALEISDEIFFIICKGTQTTWLNNFVDCEDCHNFCHQNCATSPAIRNCNFCKNRSNFSSYSVLKNICAPSSHSSTGTTNFGWSTNISSAASSYIVSTTNLVSSPKICLASLCYDLLETIRMISPLNKSYVLVKKFDRVFVVKPVRGKLYTFNIEML